MDNLLDPSILGMLPCFVAAARLKSFTKAAQALHLTQSAVSQQIRHLESRLGYELFVRQSRGLALTPKGELLYRAAAGALGDLKEALHELSNPDASLQISCLPSFALQWLVPRLQAFRSVHPDISVRLRAEYQDLDLGALETEGIDIAIRYVPVTNDTPYCRTLFDEYLLVVATPEYLRDHPPSATKTWLSSVTLLHDAEPWDNAPALIEWKTWLDAVTPGQIDMVHGLEFNLASLVISAALNHQGVALVRHALVAEELASRRLVAVLGKYVRAPAKYVLMCRQPHAHRVAAFMEWLTSEAQQFDQTRKLAPNK
ncbi:LysR substrate-binding domain-containing protein [Dyella flagellata]|uniref:LysR family transcriptional regulator n=1 Tax=Dyella flagellata TaxID=1867833 RepID=A0ABQ5X825_9GAMM|nr:LysR substrate-binding domain-containing protein [Dyella flagellata]GLQ86713.1 LysR family transcriptional regulator [Dyella flagellata]